MNSRKALFVGLILLAIAVTVAFLQQKNTLSSLLVPSIISNLPTQPPKLYTHPLMISEMRKREYPGSEITTEKTLASGTNYNQYLTSYQSDGLKINALLTVPKGQKPKTGWPVIIFNHGYIPPEQYQTTQRYEAYVAYFARNGYIVFKPDYRGHGESDGQPEGAYFSPAYTVDVLNAVSSIKKYENADPNRIGMWGHSMGGSITLRSMVIHQDIKAGVIWAGVVGSYHDMITGWRSRQRWTPSPKEQQSNRPNRETFLQQFELTEEKVREAGAELPILAAISPISNVSEISGPLQIHHGTADETVPIKFSQSLKKAMDNTGKPAEYFEYPGADHNLSGSAFSLAMKRSLEFFDKYVKNASM